MKQVIKNIASGLYFVDGQGFAGTSDTATRFATVEDATCVQNCAAKMGLGATAVEVAPNKAIKQNADGTSFAVTFIRPANVRYNDPVKGYAGSKLSNPSPRRFATEAEARHHGNRFVSANKHSGFFVSVVSEPVNSFVSKVSGKTNPIIGKGRSYA